MTQPFNLEAYLLRIGYSGPHTATFETLQALQLKHTEAIAFENLDPLLRQPVKLDAASLEHKLVTSGRGGYCFEQNGLFKLALEQLGFRVGGLAARVLWNAPEGAVTARGHMLLRVEIAGETLITDVGFGGMTPTGPLRLEPDRVQETPHEPYRLHQDGDTFTLQVALRGTWRNVYRFDLQEQLQPDYEVSNWYLSHHPNSHFISGLIASRAAPRTRYALRNNTLVTHPLGGASEQQVLTTPAALRQVLEDIFLLNLANIHELSQTLEKLTSHTDVVQPD